MNHDGHILISTGRSRKELQWKNRDMQWSDLVKKLSTTHRTAETYREYNSAKKGRQDEIKDVGGFVGGHLAGGKRRKGAVIARQLLTLDMDYAPVGFWDEFTMLYDNAACIYSTHKHSPESPRLRLVLPIDRECTPDECEAIGRRVAGNLGIEYFDPSTFQPERLMYWPSTAKDGEFLFEVQDGPWVCADEVLASYHNWRDVSEWPVSSKVDKLVQRDIAKQGDPLEKTGIVGAFCRAYTIHEAIETFLPGTYEPCAINNRYTFTGGSTAAGVVTYDDKFAFSHHATDPASSKLCNAFDLVRLHLFGLKDEDAKEGTPVNKMPSFSAMTDLAIKDGRVKQQFGEDRLQSAMGDFEGVELTEGSRDWMKELDYDKKGTLLSTIDNIVKIMENDPHLSSNLQYDLFENRPVFTRRLPWRSVTFADRYLTDRDADNMEHYIETVYGLTTGKLEKALSVIYERHKFHPVRDYLDTLSWDEQERVDTLFIDYMGAEDNEYTRAVARKMLVAAVARVMRPGIKFDNMAVTVGPQGIGKSSLFARLGRHWFSDSFTTMQGKEAYEQLQGVWIIEVAELSGMKKQEVETVKHYVSKCEDRFRVAYGKRIENFPRQCIFFGSTNKADFLRDSTGNRRFWPIRTGNPKKDLFTELTKTEVDQIWAEAVVLYEQGEPLYLPKELEAIAMEVQEQHSERDDRAGIIERYLEKLLPDGWEERDMYKRREYYQTDDELEPIGKHQRDRVCAAEIWVEAFGMKLGDMHTANTKFIHDAMRLLDDWKPYKTKARFGIYGLQRGYYRVGSFYEITQRGDLGGFEDE
jgi:predicted P-loop ATPase